MPVEGVSAEPPARHYLIESGEAVIPSRRSVVPRAPLAGLKGDITNVAACPDGIARVGLSRPTIQGFVSLQEHFGMRLLPSDYLRFASSLLCKARHSCADRTRRARGNRARGDFVHELR
jgi:hypothetical protein